MWKFIKFFLWSIFISVEIFSLMEGEVWSAIIIGGIVLGAYYFWKKDANEYDRKVASGELEREQQAEKLKREKIIKELEEKREMEQKEKEIIKKAKNVLIECEGNTFKAIKQFAIEQELNNEIAERYIQKAQMQTLNISNTSEGPIHNVDGPRCPTCGSTKVEKIGMVGKVVSVELFGLASNSMGKTFKCNKCGYKW